ncbi:MAG: hypothetical protein AAF442_04300 [Pseudomonadota bacterium]
MTVYTWSNIFMIGFKAMRLFFFFVCVMWINTVSASDNESQDCPADGSDPACFFVNDQNHPIQTVTPTSTTSDCVGDTSRRECVVDTWVTCLVQDQDPELCERIKWDQQWIRFTSEPLPRQLSIIGGFPKKLKYHITSAERWGLFVDFEQHIWGENRVILDETGSIVLQHIGGNTRFFLNRTLTGWQIHDGNHYDGIPTGIRSVTKDIITSDCIGDLSTPVCTVDTVEYCFARRDQDLCSFVAGDMKRYNFREEKEDVIYQIIDIFYDEGKSDMYRSFRSDGNAIFADVIVDHYTDNEIFTYYLWQTPRGWVFLLSDLGQMDGFECNFSEYCDSKN